MNGQSQVPAILRRSSVGKVIAAALLLSAGVTVARAQTKNDVPNIPERPGVYVIGPLGQLTEVLPEPVLRTRTRGILGMVFTFGIVKVRTESVLAGERSNTRTEGPLRFWLRLDPRATGPLPYGLPGSAFSAISPLEFALVRPRMHKGDRVFRTARIGLGRQDIGADPSQKVDYQAIDVGPGLWELRAMDSAAGEFILFRVNPPANGGLQMAYPVGTGDSR